MSLQAHVFEHYTQLVTFTSEAMESLKTDLGGRCESSDLGMVGLVITWC